MEIVRKNDGSRICLMAGIINCRTNSNPRRNGGGEEQRTFSVWGDGDATDEKGMQSWELKWGGSDRRKLEACD
ncbi:hypothetical protein NL676_026485 [Syzygium grande]|nr:hypothetical protein NL676_026485 [Syzygium grande]